MTFQESYLGQLRAKMGSQRLLAFGARVLIEDPKGRFLFIRRADNGLWGIPGGAIELGESLMDCVHREAREEVNASLGAVTPFGLSSNPAHESHTYPNGDKVQNISLLAHAFIENEDLSINDGEATEMKFAYFEDMKESSFTPTEYRTFAHWKAFQSTGKFQVV